jgi:hypothetical protein
MNRKQLIALLTSYYARTGKILPARFHDYSTLELQKSVKLFELI